MTKTKKKAKMVENDEDLPYDYDRHKGGTIFDKIVLNNKLRVGLSMFVIAVVIPLLVYAYVFDTDVVAKESDILGTCILKPEYRVPCLTGRKGITLRECSDIGCCWNTTTEECHHSIPSKYEYIVEEFLDETYLTASLIPRTAVSPFRTPSINKLKCTIHPVTEHHLRISIKDVNQSPADNTRLDLNATQFDVTIYQKGFALEIFRRVDANSTKNGTVLLSTTKGPLVASDNYWELTLQLPKDGTVYGLGRLQLKGNNVVKMLYNNANNTGSHPVVMSVDSFGQTHGIYMRNTGPLEVHFLQDSKLLILRSLAKEGFEINIFAGPTPKAVMLQLTDVLGRPKMPPYWALGLHVCRDSEIAADYKTILRDFYQFKTASEAFEMPYDSHCLHEKLLNDLTLSIANEEDLANITTALDDLYSVDRKFLLTLPLQVAIGPNLAYTSAVQQGVLVHESLSVETHYVGKYNNLPVVYPDWTNTLAASWIADRLEALGVQLGANRIAGVVLESNWPDNRKDHSVSEDLVYIPQSLNGSLSNGTLWWQSGHVNNTSHSEIHNTYGLLHAQQVAKALDASSTLLLSASTYPGSGVIGGAHLQGRINVPAQWVSLKESLISVLGLGLSGIPLAGGGPVCGSMPDFNHTLQSDEALCLKWYLLSITLPLIRVSSVAPYRDPTSFTSGFTRRAIIQALNLRYILLPYYYTTFHDAAMTGTPVARPMFLEFPDDALTRHMDEQFMVGSALLVAPIFVPDAMNVQVYLPDENTNWYQLMGGYQINNGTGRYIITISTLETDVTILLRGGYIIPTQKANQTTESSRKSPHQLIIGLNCTMTEECTAKGQLYLDHADQFTILDFSATESNLTISNLQSAQFLCSMNDTNSGFISTVIDDVNVYGIPSSSGTVVVSNKLVPIDKDFEYRKREKILKIHNLQIDWCQINDDSVTIGW